MVKPEKNVRSPAFPTTADSRDAILKEIAKLQAQLQVHNDLCCLSLSNLCC